MHRSPGMVCLFFLEIVQLHNQFEYSQLFLLRNRNRWSSVGGQVSGSGLQLKKRKKIIDKWLRWDLSHLAELIDVSQCSTLCLYNIASCLSLFRLCYHWNLPFQLHDTKFEVLHPRERAHTQHTHLFSQKVTHWGMSSVIDQSMKDVAPLCSTF